MLLRSVMARALPHGIIGSRCVVSAEVHDRPQAGRGTRDRLLFHPTPLALLAPSPSGEGELRRGHRSIASTRLRKQPTLCWSLTWAGRGRARLFFLSPP